MKRHVDPNQPQGGDGRVSEQTAEDLALIAEAFAAIEAERARLVAAMVRVQARGDGEAAVGMPLDQHLAWSTNQRVGTVHGYSTVADTIGSLPAVRDAFESGDASFDQSKAACYGVAKASRDERAAVDQHLAESDWTSLDPDVIEFEIGRVLEGLRDPREVERDRERRRRQEFLRLQPTLDGQGLDGHFRYWGLDAATVDAILHAAAGAPQSEDGDGWGATRRQRSLASGLLDVLVFWQTWATGTDLPAVGVPDGPRRPAARLVVVKDEHKHDGGRDQAAVWASTPGLDVELTAAELGRLDPQRTTIRIDDQARPVSVDGRDGHAVTDPEKVTWETWKLLTIVRDGGCRMPGCSNPARWTEVHHLRHRRRGGKHRWWNLVGLCRRCHLRLVHVWDWTALLDPGGTASWARSNRDVTTTLPRLKRRLRALPPIGPPSTALEPAGGDLPF